MSRSTRVCSTPGCPNLSPCPKHSRPRNASWSTDRPRQAQHAFRLAVLARDGRCTFPGCTITNQAELVAHHDRPGFTPDCGRTLCREHHREVDRHAR